MSSTQTHQACKCACLSLGGRDSSLIFSKFHVWYVNRSRNQVWGFPWRLGLCNYCLFCLKQNLKNAKYVPAKPLFLQPTCRAHLSRSDDHNPHQALPQILSPSSRPCLLFVHCLLFGVISDIRLMVATDSCSQTIIINWLMDRGTWWVPGSGMCSWGSSDLTAWPYTDRNQELLVSYLFCGPKNRKLSRIPWESCLRYSHVKAEDQPVWPLPLTVEIPRPCFHINHTGLSFPIVFPQIHV